MASATRMFAIAAMVAFAQLLCAQSNGGSISGNVTNSVTGAGLEGVKVQASCMSGSGCFPGKQGVTDIAGAFRIAGIPDGRYAIAADKGGFSQVRKSASDFTLSVSGDTRFDLQLTPFAKLSGRVVDPDGKPAAGIQVQLNSSSKVTDLDGAFVFENVRPGYYTLLAKVKPQADGKDAERTVTTYYPSVVYPEQASSIEMQGVDLFGYEIRLRSAPARAVRGVVLDSAGKPAPQVSVVLAQAAVPRQVIWMRGGTSIGAFAQVHTTWDSTKTGDDGAFEFPEVLEGDWRIQASGFSSAGIADLRVGKSDVENVSIRLPQLFEIVVSADWGESQTGEQPEIPVLPQTFLLAVNGQLFAFLNINEPAKLHAGQYLVAPWTPPTGYYAAAAMLDGRDVLGKMTEFTGPGTLKMVYKKDGGTVRGTVEHGSGATVVLMTDATSSPRFGYNGRCDADGNFSIRDVPPARYTIATFTAAAYEDAQFARSGNPEFLSRVDRGERVKVDASAVTAVTLTLN